MRPGRRDGERGEAGGRACVTVFQYLFSVAPDSEARGFGSNVGFEYMAMTAPVCGSRTTMAPIWLPSAALAACCNLVEMVRVTVSVTGVRW